MNLGALMLLGTISSIGHAQEHAKDWQTILSCENGQAYIDVDKNERRNLQLVFKGEDMLRRMRDAGFIAPQFGDKEKVIQGIHAELRQITPTETQPISLGGVFYPWDFKKMISESTYVTFEIESHGSMLAVKFLSVTSGTRCIDYWTVDGNQECREYGDYHKTYRLMNETILEGCHLLP